jgi:hypothetical protein
VTIFFVFFVPPKGDGAGTVQAEEGASASSTPRLRGYFFCYFLAEDGAQDFSTPRLRE